MLNQSTTWPGFVYFVGAHTVGFIKIGFSRSRPDRQFIALRVWRALGISADEAIRRLSGGDPAGKG
jgi:hypothetical protein